MDVLGLQTGYETNNTNEKEKKHDEEAEADKKTAEEEQETPVLLITHVNNFVHSTFSDVEVFFSHQQFYNSYGLYALKFLIFNSFKGAIFHHKAFLHCKRNEYEEFADEIMDAMLSELFFTKRMKMFCRPDGYMLYGILGVEFFSTSEMLYPGMKSRLQLTRA